MGLCVRRRLHMDSLFAHEWLASVCVCVYAGVGVCVGECECIVAS